jgi:uncharacterized protein YlzI (FlbEa/FlbD family)
MSKFINVNNIHGIRLSINMDVIDSIMARPDNSSMITYHSGDKCIMAELSDPYTDVMKKMNGSVETVVHQFKPITTPELIKEPTKELFNAPTEKIVNRGAKWTPEEEDRLTMEYKNGMTIQTMAQTHSRTVNGIQARLEKLGLVDEQYYPPATTSQNGSNVIEMINAKLKIEDSSK